MPLPVIANTFRVSLNWSYGALNAANVFHVRAAATQSAAQILTVVEAAMLGGGTGTENFRDMFAATASNCGLDTLEVIALDGSSTTVSDAQTGITGGGTTADIIPAAAAIVTQRTAIRGRSYRGRIFTPFVNETVQTVGMLDTAIVTRIQDGWEDFVALLGGATPVIKMVVASYKLSVATDVTSFTAQRVLGTIRKRQSQLR